MCWGLEDQSYALGTSTSLLLETEVSCFQDESGEPEDMTSNVPPKALQCHKSPLGRSGGAEQASETSIKQGVFSIAAGLNRVNHQCPVPD